MIEFCTGNIFLDDAECIVVPVNCVGVMGAGLARPARIRWPLTSFSYKEQCSLRRVIPGDCGHLPGSGEQMLWLATKNQWQHRSREEWICAGLFNLRDYQALHRIRSLAVPALGCGHGELEWSRIRPILRNILDDLDIPVRLYEPWDATPVQQREPGK